MASIGNCRGKDDDRPVTRDSELDAFAAHLMDEVGTLTMEELVSRLHALGVDAPAALFSMKARLEHWGRERGIEVSHTATGLELATDSGELIHINPDKVKQ